MLNIDLFDKNKLRRKEISKFLINENFIIRTYDDLDKTLLDAENIKLIYINDNKAYSNYKDKLIKYNNKEQIIIIIEKKLAHEINNLIENNISNHIYLPMNSINELIIKISEFINKTGFITDKKNLLSSLLDDFISFIDENKVSEINIKDKLKNKINILNKLIKQYEKSRHEFSGLINETPLFEILKFIQLFFNKGIIKIKSDNIEGQIFINNNSILNTTSNVFSNSIKSFDLLSCLNNGTYIFTEHYLNTPNKELSSYNFNTLIQRSYSTYKWFKINKANLPSESIKLKINKKILFSTKINKFDFEVLSDIVKNPLIKNILALSCLNLIDTYETLINLRKKAILEVCK